MIGFAEVSIPQSGFGAFELSEESHDEPHNTSVSIPQSGFGAFEPSSMRWICTGDLWFQSLSRDSGRLNHFCSDEWRCSVERFNPSVGIRGV